MLDSYVACCDKTISFSNWQMADSGKSNLREADGMSPPPMLQAIFPVAFFHLTISVIDLETLNLLTLGKA